MSSGDTMAGLHQAAREIFLGSLETCRVETAFRSRLLHRVPSDTPPLASSFVFQIQGAPPIDLAPLRHVVVVAVGKGASPMLSALLASLSLPPHCVLRCVLIAPEAPPDLPEHCAFFRGGHPLPDEASVAGARAALRLVQQAAQRTEAAQTSFCFFLVSGGASAMMELPLDRSISLADVLAFHRALIHSGASIAEINCVRKHFSAVKGGRLLAAAGDMPSLTIAVSDVPKQHLDALGSGPTLPDRSTVQQCQDILKRYDLLTRFPASVRAFFASPDLPETPKPSAYSSSIVTLLSSEDLAQAAQGEAEARGFHVLCDDLTDDWDYREAAHHLLGRLRALRDKHDHVCLVAAGEVTVTVQQDPALPGEHTGRGGRNQQFALYLASLLTPADGSVVVLSAGSDGIDGNSPAAGAVIDSALLQGHMPGSDAWRLQAAHDALLHFDAFPFLQSLGATIMTGPTGNNLRDLRLLLATSSTALTPRSLHDVPSGGVRHEPAT